MNTSSTSSEANDPHLLTQVTGPEIERVRPQLCVKEKATPGVNMPYRDKALTHVEGVRTANVEKLWDKALGEEDCLAVMTLLEIYPGLLRIGWGNTYARREHKDRTALHVAARRGCIDLIKQVLTLCEFDVNTTTKAQGIVQNLKRAVISKTPKLSEGESSQHSMDLPAKQGELAKGVLACWRRKVAKGKESSDLANAAGWGYLDYPEDDGSHALSMANSHYGHLGSLNLWDLLHCVDSEYQLDAFHMIAVHGRKDHLAFLTSAKDQLEHKIVLYPVGEKAPLTKDCEERLKLLRTAMKDVMASYSGLESCLEEYTRHRDFNFLPLKKHPEYLFHYSFTTRFNQALGGPFDYDVRRKFRKTLWEAICSFSNEVWRFVLNLQDGQGRPPIHVAIAEKDSLIFEFFDVISYAEDEVDDSLKSCRVRHEAQDLAMHAFDAAQRTPMYRAAATGNSRALQIMQEGFCSAGGDLDEDAATLYSPWRYTMPLSHDNDLRCSKKMYSCTPLHAAIIHSHVGCVEQLLPVMHKLPGEDVSYMGERSKLQIHDRDRMVQLDSMKLALIVGDKAIVNLLHKNGYLATARPYSVCEGYVTHPWPSLHIAASHGDYEMLKLFIDSSECGSNLVRRLDHFLRDFEGNSPLHHTLQLTDFGFTFNWLDCVTFDQILSKNCPRPKRAVLNDKRIAEVQGCVNLLM